MTCAAEHSRIAFGSYALYDNGELIEPVVLAPFALCVGWTWLLSRDGDRRLACALYAGGLSLGVGMSGVIAVALGPQTTRCDVREPRRRDPARRCFFVVPAALVAAGTLWLVRSGRLAITPLSAAFAMVIAALTVPSSVSILGS